MVNRTVKNAVLLTTAGLVLRAQGMILRVVIAGQLGGEGMGLYQLILSFYNVSVSLATAGFEVAATRMASQMLSEGRSSGPVLARLVRIGLLAGGSACLGQLLLAEPAADLLLGDARAATALRLLAPSLPFMALAAVWRGYFLACRNVVPNIVSQLAEQAVRMLLAFGLLRAVLPYGLGSGCAAIALGTTVSEALSCLLMCFFYRKKQPRIRPTSERDRQLRGILLPLQADRLLNSALRAAENALIPTCLMLYLGSRSEAMRQFGALKGMALPVVLFPFSFLAALTSLLIPEVTAAYTRGDYPRIRISIHRTMLLTSVVSFWAAGLCVLCGHPLGILLYNDAQAGLCLAALGPVLPFMYIEGMIDGILNGLGEQMAGLRYSLFDSLLRIGWVLILVPRYGLQGLLWMMAFSNGITCFLNVRRMLHCAHMQMYWRAWVLRPLLCLVPAVTAGIAAAHSLSVSGPLPALVLYGGVVSAVYLPLAWLAGLHELLPGHLRKATA